MPHLKRSLRPFGYRGKFFERRRDAEAFVEKVLDAGYQASWRPWGKRFKVYYERAYADGQ